MKFFLICALLATVAHGAPANDDLFQFVELLENLVLDSTAPSKAIKTLIPGSPLGNALNIHKFDLLGEELYGGYPFFKSFKQECVKDKLTLKIVNPNGGKQTHVIP
jgi:hypothetical protein